MQATNERHEMRPGPAGPGPVGLLIRVILGAAAVYALVELITQWDSFRDRNLIESDFWFITLFTLCLLPDLFNIGLRRQWALWPWSSSWPAQRRSGRPVTWPHVKSGPPHWPHGCTRATCWSSQPSRCRSPWRS
jgi:hypothetical protein